MTTLSSLLPKPKNSYSNEEEEEPLFQKQTVIATTTTNKDDNKPKKIIPPYGKRKGYLPKNIEDFGDGGAFPEIHIVQYPLDMGRKSKSNKASSSNNTASTSIVPINVDSSGRVKYEAILGAKGSLHSQYKDLIPKQFSENDLQRPDDEELQETLDRTKNALEKIVNGKIKSSKSTNQVDVEKKGATYIKYTPSNQSGGTSNGLASKIIRMVDVAQDPMEPPKYKIKKKSKEHGSPPAPVMHSPTRKLTVQEHQDWSIPPCISNWKNPKGFAIAIDKRLASNGGGLQDVEINDKFAHFTQALYIAESNAREEVAARSELERKLSQKEKERKQEMLRKLAEDVRNERSGIIQQRSNGSNNRKDDSDSDSSSGDSDREDNRGRASTTNNNNNNNRRSNDRKSTRDSDDEFKDEDGFDNRFRIKDNRANRGRRDDSPERRDERRDISRDSRDSRDNRDIREYRSGSDDRHDSGRDISSRENLDRRDSGRDNRRDNSRERDRNSRDDRHRSNSRDRYKKKSNNRSDSDSSSSDSEDERKRKERKEKLERDKLRIEKKRELEREYRLEASGKKSKFNRDQDRDISEKIALGQASASRTEDSIYDQRLFNQSESVGSGFGNDDAYNVYSKPLFGGAVSNSIYRPKANQEENTTVEDVLSKSRFGGNNNNNNNNNKEGGQRPNKEFSGADRSKERTGPVAFEKEKKKSDDPFGFNDFSKK